MTSTRGTPLLDRLLAWSFDHTIGKPARYALATLLIVTVALVRGLFITAILPWLLFIPAVMMIGLMLGRGPGLYATTLAAIAAGLSIGSTAAPAWLTVQQWVGSALFLLVSAGIAILSADLRAAFARARLLAEEQVRTNLVLAEREGFLSSVLGSSTDCIKVLDLEARLTFMSDGGMKVMEVSDFNDIAGCPWPDFWQGDGNAEARAAIDAAVRGESRTFIGRASTMKGTPRWWNVAVSPILGADGRPERILSVSRDITASRENEEQRSQLVRIVENSADFIGMAQLDGRVFFLNDAALDLIGLDRAEMGTVSMTDFFPPDEAAIVRDEVLPHVAAAGSWSGERSFRHFRTGERIPVLYTVFPIIDQAGGPIGYGTVTRDFRERKKAEEQQALLNNELSHRLKNVLSVVQSVAAQTLRQAQDLPSANDALSARLAALGQATDLLTAQSWAAADLGQVVAKALAPHGGIGDRFRLSGPAITLLPQVTLALALALHELATNAAKYGALSNDVGHVDLWWAVEAGANGAEPRFTLRWQETGGPHVSPPTRRGFGSMMIERSLRSYFRGRAEIDYRSSGLLFTLDAALGDAGRLDGQVI